MYKYNKKLQKKTKTRLLIVESLKTFVFWQGGIIKHTWTSLTISCYASNKERCETCHSQNGTPLLPGEVINWAADCIRVPSDNFIESFISSIRTYGKTIKE